VERLVAALADHEFDAEDVADEPGNIEGVGPVPGARRVGRGSGRIVAGQHRGDVQRLVRDAVVQCVKHLIGRLDAERRDGRRAELPVREEY
jgi:hypothetical protein